MLKTLTNFRELKTLNRYPPRIRNMLCLATHFLRLFKWFPDDQIKPIQACATF